MEQYGRTCGECGRGLPPAFVGDVCAMCRQERQEQALRLTQAAPLAQQALEQPAGQRYIAGITLDMLAPRYQRAVRGLASLERVNAVIWLVIAVLQIISVVCALIGVYNIVVCINALRRATEYENLEPSVPEQEERALGSIIVFIFLNLFLGGVIGVVACFLALHIRSRILAIREAFEDPHSCLDREPYGAW